METKWTRDDFKVGEYVIYKYSNMDLYEIGRIKELRDNGAFVAYHDGDTGAMTPYDLMHKLLNGRFITASTLGGDYFNMERRSDE